MTKNIFDWNHISSNLTQDQITELKEYYQTYHRKCWAFKQAEKNWKFQFQKIGTGDLLLRMCARWENFVVHLRTSRALSEPFLSR